MAHVVQLTDGTTTITLTSSPYAVNRYEMSTTQVSVQEVPSRDLRNRFKGAEYGAITDQIRVFIQGTTPADAQAKFDDIERMLQSAFRSTNIPTAPEVTLKVQMSSDSSSWRSHVFFGTIQPDRDMFQSLPQSKIEATISITRDVFRGTLTQLSLSNTHGSGTAVTVYNHEDSTHRNSATITTTIAGSLPAPVKLRLKNSSGGSLPFKNVYFGVNSHSDPANLDHIIEGEDSLYGTTVVSSTSSGGNHKTSTASELSYTNTVFAWTLDSTFLSRAKGESFIMLARFKGTPPDDCVIASQVGTYDSPLFIPTWKGKEILVENFEELVNLGPVPLPGPKYIAGTNYSYGVGIGARSLAGGSKTLTLDYILLLPADNWANMKQASSLLMLNNEYVVMDDIEGEFVYQKGSPNYEKLHVFSKVGPRMHVTPGVTNKIYCAWENLSAATIDLTCSLEAWYEPRRITI